jgi:hypothetical protein
VEPNVGVNEAAKTVADAVPNAGVNETLNAGVEPKTVTKGRVCLLKAGAQRSGGLAK